MTEACSFAQCPCGVAVLFALEQYQVAVRAQHGFQRRLPAGIAHLDHVGQCAVRDAGFGQLGAEGGHVGVGRCAAAFARGAQRFGLFLEALNQRALFEGQLRDRRVGRRVFGFQRERIGTVLAGDALAQLALFVQQPFDVAQCVVGGKLRVVRPELLLACFGQRRRSAFAFASHGVQPCRYAVVLERQPPQILAQPCDAAALGRYFTAQFGHLEARYDLGFERLHFVRVLLPLAEVVRFEPLRLGLCAQPFEIETDPLELALGAFLLLARRLVVVQHFLVAEYVEHQVEQGARRVFAQLVGVALFQRQHLGDGRRQSAPGQPVLVVAQADPVAAGFQRLDVGVAVDDGVVARPVAAGAPDAAGQRDFIAQAGKEGALAGAAGVVGHHRAYPRNVAIGAAHIAAEVALARTAQREQRAQCVEQRGLARTVGPDDGDDLGVQGQREAAPEIPVHQFELLDVEHACVCFCSGVGYGAGGGD